MTGERVPTGAHDAPRPTADAARVKVSVVIPLFAKERHIKRALNSVLAQSFRDFEVLVVDDGSTDGGADVVGVVGDPRVRLLRQENAGESAARNRGIAEAQAELVALLDADDEWLPDFLSTVLEAYERFPQAGMFGTAYSWCENGTMRRPAFASDAQHQGIGLIDDYFRAALGPSPICASAVMVPRRVFEEVGGFPLGVRRGGDLEMWARIAFHYPVAWTPATLSIYHLSADNRACNLVPVGPDVAAACSLEGLLRTGTMPVSSSREAVDDYVVKLRLGLARHHILQGNRRWARDVLRLTRANTRFRRERMVLLAAYWLPRPLLSLALRAKAVLRRMRGVHSGEGITCLPEGYG
jgi:glycosyltransferase involved in cell wall biosynthesis